MLAIYLKENMLDCWKHMLGERKSKSALVSTLT